MGYAVVVKNPTKQDVMVTVKKEGYAFDSKLITKEEFAAQAAIAPKDVALANKKETLKKELDNVSKTQASTQNKTDVAVNTKKVSESTIEKPNSKNTPTSTVSKTTNVTNNDQTFKKSESIIVPTKTVTNSDKDVSKKSVSSAPVDLEVQKIVPQSTSKNTPVSMPKNDLVVKKLKVGVAYTINDILFETSSSELSERSKFILKEFSSFLVENPTSKIMIQGHTDDNGEDAENLKLSEDRAKAVKDYLTSLNIKSDRMTAKGFGETMPKLPNSSDENRAKNRRTDFVLEKF